ncbi:MAG: chemotaxis-specific protein-glutamate methyltransferase CheB [Magnetococcales bacterium]|nr:chemotaxis-specific protein-glutamate methyltransferase CheB [Magnetococcales bacterium]
MSVALKVMVVDDTITYRMIVKMVAESIPGVQVTASTSNGKLAIAKLATMSLDERPHAVLLDVEMPEMDGLTALQEIRRQYPDLQVVMVSGASRSNANIVMECLNAGALDFVIKPLESDAHKAKEALRRDLEPILAVVRQKSQRQGPGPAAPASRFGAPPPPAAALHPRRHGVETPPLTAAAPAPPPRRRAAGPGGPPDLLLIGSSTGGPAALTTVLASLGGRLNVPALIVQHMPPVFTASLAQQLTRSSGLTVREAQAGMTAAPGEVILAQGGHHMTMRRHGAALTVELNDGPKVNECRPAVDVLFMSVATQWEGTILSVILTGMGRDGAKGVEALKKIGKNVYCLTQDKESCVVYGMPRAVDELGMSDESLPLDQIGPRILELCKS